MGQPTRAEMWEEMCTLQGFLVISKKTKNLKKNKVSKITDVIIHWTKEVLYLEDRSCHTGVLCSEMVQHLKGQLNGLSVSKIHSSILSLL
jgi:hypothetical protein